MSASENRATKPDASGAGGIGIGIGIKRNGRSVHISLGCHGEYQAMELYDRLVEAAERGLVSIDLKAR